MLIYPSRLVLFFEQQTVGISGQRSARISLDRKLYNYHRNSVQNNIYNIGYGRYTYGYCNKYQNTPPLSLNWKQGQRIVRTTQIDFFNSYHSTTSTLQHPKKWVKKMLIGCGVGAGAYIVYSFRNLWVPPPPTKVLIGFGDLPPGWREDNVSPFKDKSTFEILNSLAVFKLCSFPSLVSMAPTLLSIADALHLSAPIDAFTKATFFRHFCGKIFIVILKFGLQYHIFSSANRYERSHYCFISS